MNRYIPKEVLINKIIFFSKKSIENYQVLKRLKKLLPTRLEYIKQKYCNEYTKGKAQRLALQDSEYQEHLKEVIQIAYLSKKYRILWETYTMFYYARKYR